MKLLGFCLTFASFVLSVSSVLAQQTVTVDWASHTITSSPIEVNGTTAVIVEIDNINDYLYSYNGVVVASSSQTPPIPPALAPAACSIQAQLDGMNEAFLDPQEGIAGNQPPASISLSNFQKEYTKDRAFLDNLSASDAQACYAITANKKKMDYWRSHSSNWATLWGTRHQFVFHAALEPLTNYQIKISERYQGVLTNLRCTDSQTVTGTCALEYDPSNDILSNSQGFLVTLVPGYTYSRATVPGSSDAQLQVTTTGPARIAAAALFNVRVPLGNWIERSNYAVAVSFGPAYLLDNKNHATTQLGFFGGLSLVMYRHFLLTPGVHIAEYAGFPAGFTKTGQDIPSTFTGQLTPTTKNTIRFGITLSFKDWSIIKSNSGGQVTAPKK